MAVDGGRLHFLDTCEPLPFGSLQASSREPSITKQGRVHHCCWSRGLGAGHGAIHTAGEGIPRRCKCQQVGTQVHLRVFRAPGSCVRDVAPAACLSAAQG